MVRQLCGPPTPLLDLAKYAILIYVDPTLAAPPSQNEHSPVPSYRRPWIIGITVAVIVLLLIGLVGQFGAFLGARMIRQGSPRLTIYQGESVTLEVPASDRVQKLEICDDKETRLLFGYRDFKRCSTLTYFVKPGISQVTARIPTNYEGRAVVIVRQRGADNQLLTIAPRDAKIALWVNPARSQPAANESTGESGGGGGKSQPASPPSGWIAFSNNEVGISFFYPPAWGEVIPTDNPYRTEYAYAYVFSILDRERRYPIGKNMDIEVNIVKDNRPRGKTVKDSYSGEGGNTSRVYTLFTGAYRIEIYANYSVSDLYANVYKQGDSILELVRNDIGKDLRDPIKNLLRVHPDWTEMKTFYVNVDTMVSTMKY